MIAASLGSTALQLSPDLRIVTKISRGSDTKYHPLFMERGSNPTEYHS